MLTYDLLNVARQESTGAARLLPGDHAALVAALGAFETDHARYGDKIDVYIVKQETLDQRAMLQLLAKTDVSRAFVTPSPDSTR